MTIWLSSVEFLILQEEMPSKFSFRHTGRFRHFTLSPIQCIKFGIVLPMEILVILPHHSMLCFIIEKSDGKRSFGKVQPYRFEMAVERAYSFFPPPFKKLKAHENEEPEE